MFGDSRTASQPLVGLGGTNNFFVYSEALKPPLVMNEMVTGTIPAGPSNVFIRIGANQYGPQTYATPLTPKATAGVDSLQSESGNIATGTATYTAATNLVRAFGFVSPRITGKGAAAAFDPFMVSSDVPDYQYIINASLHLDRVGDFGGLNYFALDSRFTDPLTFYERGQPFQEALWSLSISTNGRLTSKMDNDLQVAFQINHREVLNPTLSDSQITDLIKMGFTISGGTATLTEFPLFPINTTYLVDQSITYGVGVNAGLTAVVPEPSTLTLFSAGIIGLLGCAGLRCFFVSRSR